jgi:2-hydroxychromene-2-carboxylate isomerase
MRRVDFYFDFVSPYAYLALAQASEFAARHDVSWRLVPVVYGVLLDRTGLVGPVETAAKRRYTFLDASRSAQLLGVPLAGPPEHPFRSLAALRLATAYRDDPLGLPLASALATAAWAGQSDLTSTPTLERIAAEVGASRTPVAEIIADPTVKLALREGTDQALHRGVFGVPTFAYDDELFWGHDRLPHLAARLAGQLDRQDARVEELLQRPRGVDRRQVPKG